VQYRRLHRAAPAGKINVTPLIDVIMVLIIFYLIVGKLAADRVAPVDLPSSGVGTAEDQTPTLVISVAAAEGGARVVIDGREVSEGELDAVLKARLAEPAAALVHLRADRRLAYGLIAPVIEACRRAGVVSLKLVTERGEP